MDSSSVLSSSSETDEPADSVQKFPSCSVGQVKSNLASGEFKAVEKRNAKSAVWNSFYDVIDKNGKTVEYAQCKNCHQIYAAGRKNGTSTMRKHSCSSAASIISSTPPLTQWMKSGKTKLTTDDKKAVTNAAAYLCGKDLRPFEIVAGKGFTSFVDCILRMGSKYPNVRADDILPDPTTVSRNITDQASLLQEKMKPLIEEVFSKCGGGITTDFWTDDYRKYSYVAITAHFIVLEWELSKRLLGIYAWDPEDRHTGDNIRPFLYQKLREYGLLDSVIRRNCIFVTDQGSNFMKALRHETRLNCYAHILNNIMKAVLESESDETAVFRHCLDACSSLVGFISQSNLKPRLSTALHQDSQTRWYAKLNLLKSVLTAWDEIEVLLDARDESDRLAGIDREIVEKLIDVLTPFKEAITSLEQVEVPTLHSVWLHFLRLKRHLECDYVADDTTVRMLKMALSIRLEEKYHITDEHKLATVLHPSYKSLNFGGSDTVVPILEKMALYNHLRRLVSAVVVLDDESPSSISIEETSDHSAPKKSHLVDDGFLNMFCSRPIADTVDELGKYLASEDERVTTENLLSWWKTKSTVYPRLSQVARKYLAVPASSGASESVFSSAGHTITDLRSRLKPEKVQSIVFLHCNG